MTEQNCKPGELSLGELLACDEAKLNELLHKEEYAHLREKILLALLINRIQKLQKDIDDKLKVDSDLKKEYDLWYNES